MSISPFVNSAAWDVIVIGGVTSPGLAEWSTVPKRAYTWDKKKGKGTKGETLTFVQIPASNGKVTFKLWTDEHFTAWDAFRPLFKYDPTKKTVEAIEIYHPCCAEIELHSVVTESLSATKHEGKGLYTIEWEFSEYFPPDKTSATSTPNTSTANADGTTPGTNGNNAQSQLDQENSALLSQAQSEGAL